MVKTKSSGQTERVAKAIVLTKICWGGIPLPVQVRLTVPFSIVKTQKRKYADRPESAGIYTYRGLASGRDITAIVEVTETSGAGRLCASLGMGGHKNCGLEPWKGKWLKLNEIEVQRQVTVMLKRCFGIDNFGYGINAAGVVVYNYGKAKKSTIRKIPSSILGIPISVEFMGKVVAY